MDDTLVRLSDLEAAKTFLDTLNHAHSQPSQNWPAAGSMSLLLHSRRKMYYFCFVANKVKKTPKKKLPDNNLKVRAPTVFTSLEFLKTQNSDLCSITKIFIAFIGVLGKKCHFHVMHLTGNRFTWICSVLHL